MSNELEGELHSMLNIRSFHITPYQSCANGIAEKCNFFITQIVKCISQNNVVTEQNLQLCLSFSALAWNSTPLVSTGLSPGHLHLGGKMRTHNFICFSSLKNAENKHSLIKDLAIVRETLFQLLQRKNPDKVTPTPLPSPQASTCSRDDDLYFFFLNPCWARASGRVESVRFLCGH